MNRLLVRFVAIALFLGILLPVYGQIPASCPLSCTGSQQNQLDALERFLALDCSKNHLDSLTDPELVKLFNDSFLAIGQLVGPEQMLDSINQSAGFDVCSAFTVNDRPQNVCAYRFGSLLKWIPRYYNSSLDQLVSNVSSDQWNLVGLATGRTKESILSGLGEKKECFEVFSDRFGSSEWLSTLDCPGQIPRFDLVSDCSQMGNPPGCRLGDVDDYCNAADCGNETVEKPSEQCEPNFPLQTTCADLGYGAGNLTCNTSCQFDYSLCPGFEESREPQTPSAIQCRIPDGRTGLTGSINTPKVNTYYWWSLSDRSLPDFDDSTQLLIQVLLEMNKMTINAADSGSFELNLMADGISEDFRRDFDYYFSSVSLLEAPSFYQERGFDKVVLDFKKLRFVPSSVSKPGRYRIDVSKEGDNWTVNLSRLKSPASLSLLYFVSLDHMIGLNKRPDEEKAFRDGYGSSLFPEMSLHSAESPVQSSLKNFSFQIDDSFETLNRTNPGGLLSLDFQSNDMVSNPSKPYPLFLQSERGNGAPTSGFRLYSGVDTMVSSESYLNWRFLGSTSSCSEVSRQLENGGIRDLSVENRQKAFVIETPQMALLKENIGGEAVLTREENICHLASRFGAAATIVDTRTDPPTSHVLSEGQEFKFTVEERIFSFQIVSIGVYATDENGAEQYDLNYEVFDGEGLLIDQGRAVEGDILQIALPDQPDLFTGFRVGPIELGSAGQDLRVNDSFELTLEGKPFQLFISQIISASEEQPGTVIYSYQYQDQTLTIGVSEGDVLLVYLPDEGRYLYSDWLVGSIENVSFTRSELKKRDSVAFQNQNGEFVLKVTGFGSWADSETGETNAYASYAVFNKDNNQVFHGAFSGTGYFLTVYLSEDFSMFDNQFFVESIETSQRDVEVRVKDHLPVSYLDEDTNFEITGIWPSEEESGESIQFEAFFGGRFFQGRALAGSPMTLVGPDKERVDTDYSFDSVSSLPSVSHWVTVGETAELESGALLRISEIGLEPPGATVEVRNSPEGESDLLVRIDSGATENFGEFGVSLGVPAFSILEESPPQCSAEENADYHILNYLPQEGEKVLFGTVAFGGNESMYLKETCTNTFSDMNPVAGFRDLKSLLRSFQENYQELCWIEDSSKGTVGFYWNTDNILMDSLESRESATDFVCTAREKHLRIVDAKTSFEQYRPNESVSVWAQLSGQTAFSNSDFHLFVTPPNGAEERKKAIFYDDGEHNDADREDGIWGATLADGFAESGSYRFRVTLTDAGGNTLEKTGSFSVVESPPCITAFSSGSLEDKINIVFTAENIDGRRFWTNGLGQAGYQAFVNEFKDWFLERDPIKDFKEKFNILVTTQEPQANCRVESDSVGEFGDSYVNCDLPAIQRTVRSCGVPQKTGIRTALDNKYAILSDVDDATSNARENFIFLDSLSGPGTIIHELGHTFEIADYYMPEVGQQFGVPLTNDNRITDCSQDDRLQCNMCIESLWPDYVCGLTLRFSCNLSVRNHPETVSYGECPKEERSLNDYSFLKWVLGQAG